MGQQIRQAAGARQVRAAGDLPHKVEQGQGDEGVHDDVEGHHQPDIRPHKEQLQVAENVVDQPELRASQGQEELPQGLCVVAVPEVQIIPVQACHFYPLIDPEGKKEEYPQSEEVFHPEKPFLLFIHCCKFLFPL